MDWIGLDWTGFEKGGFVKHAFWPLYEVDSECITFSLRCLPSQVCYRIFRSVFIMTYDNSKFGEVPFLDGKSVRPLDF